jgi:hypothetical protein
MMEFGKQGMFHKSSFSGADNPACVEVGLVIAEVLVRDTKDRRGPVLHFTPDEWTAFVTGVKNDEFDLA